MLRFLRIRDFALIRDLEIEFAPGLNVMTGETGSGKSIIVDFARAYSWQALVTGNDPFQL